MPQLIKQRYLTYIVDLNSCLFLITISNKKRLFKLLQILIKLYIFHKYKKAFKTSAINIVSDTHNELTFVRFY